MIESKHFPILIENEENNIGVERLYENEVSDVYPHFQIHADDFRSSGQFT